MSKSSRQSGFTLLELVVVLTILAVLTTLATRVLDQVQDQNRYDASQRGLREIEAAVLGDADERAADGTRVMSGFVADMGRLPRATELIPNGRLTLRELWAPLSAPPFDARPAIIANGVPLSDQDVEVLVPGGWRGPYLRLPIGATDLLDGWGNPYNSPIEASPEHPESIGYARLRGSGDTPISSAGQPIFGVRHLGSDGILDGSTDEFKGDQYISFEGRYAAELKASVQVVDEDGPAPGSGTDKVIVRVFGPNPDDASKIQVLHATERLVTTPAIVPAPATAPADRISGLTIGRRAVRAYLYRTLADGSLDETPLAKSIIKYIPIQPGLNFVEFTIRRGSIVTPPSNP
ncbi:type II secretion system protein [Verrucomicrobiota bacterium sgz303538]